MQKQVNDDFLVVLVVDQWSLNRLLRILNDFDLEWVWLNDYHQNELLRIQFRMTTSLEQENACDEEEQMTM